MGESGKEISHNWSEMGKAVTDGRKLSQKGRNLSQNGGKSS